jgi:tetratricopeptide (TPR) repeat protein/class 3 adenylate cyclase
MDRVEPPAGHVTILFTDIEDSSRMTNALRGVYRENLLPEHNRRTRAAVAAHNGYVVKTIGDSFMLAFEQASDALACAIGIQEGMATPPLAATDDTGKTWTIKLRIGVHHALEALQPHPSPECEADYHGADVNFAARIESLGAGGQILVSEHAYKSAKAASDQWKEWPNRRIKSFDRPETVWEFLWDGQSRGEPGSHFLPDWFKGEQNRYISRSRLESQVLSQFGKLQADGSVPRLVTLHASGGMGKTRLAVACAIQAVGAFRDGVYFVKLEDLPRSALAVEQAIGSVLGLSQEARRRDNLLAHLAGKDLLLLLDNYESVDCDEVQDFLIALLKGAGDVRLLVTGREAVKISEVEQEISLDGNLTEAEAEELFLARARLKHRLGQAWRPSEDELSDIRRIVALAERIPLAVEFAAAWVKYSEVKEIREGLESMPLGRQSQEPPRSARIDQADRHRSLTRSLNYSFERLEPWAQDGLARLGLFAESFTIDSVKGACNLPEAGDLLFRLHDASLIYRFEKDGRSRYTMLRATRAYAEEKLAALPEAPALRQSYIRYFRESAAQKWPLTDAADSAQRSSALDYLEEEWPNILSAARSAFAAGDGLAVYQIAQSVSHFWRPRGHWSEAEEIYGFALRICQQVANRAGEAITLNDLGSTYLVQGRWKQAEQAHQQSLAIARECNNRKGEAHALSFLGDVFLDQGRLNEAERTYEQSLAIYRELQDREGEASPIHNLASVYERQGRWKEAERVHLQALAIWRELKDRVSEAKALNNLAAAYYSQGRWGEAEQAFKQCLATSREFKDRLAEAQILQNLGAVLAIQHKESEAEQAYHQGLAIHREFNNRRMEGSILHNLGNLYASQGRPREAEQAHLQSLAIFREFKDRVREGTSLTSIGSVYYQQGQWDKAEQAFLESLAIMQDFGNRLEQGRCLVNLGIVYGARKQWEEAEQAYQQSLAISREANDPATLALSLQNLGMLYQSQGRPEDAEKCLLETLTIRRKLGDRAGEASTLSCLGSYFFALRRWPESEQAFEQCVALYRQLDQASALAQEIENAGIVYGAQGRFAESERAYLESAPIFRGLGNSAAEARVLSRLARAYYARGQWPDAERTYLRVAALRRELGDRVEEAQILHDLGNTYFAQSRWPEAQQAYEQALPAFRELKDRKPLATLLFNLGNVYKSQGLAAKAVEIFLEYVATVQELKDRSREAQALTDLAGAYVAQTKWPDAERALLESLVIRRELKERLAEGDLLQSLGMLYSVMGKRPEAEQAYQQCLLIFRELMDRANEGKTLRLLAQLREAAQDIPAALEFARSAVSALEQTRNANQLKTARETLARLENQSKPQAS